MVNSRSMQAVVFMVGCCLFVSISRAEWIVDPKPAMTWKKLKKCELVIVGHYARHKDRLSLTLKVDRVLKGTRVKAGDPLSLTLEHWYSIETGPVGIDALTTKAKTKLPKHVPKLCYKEQLINPGPALPVKVVRDLRQPAIYFIEKEREPNLVVQRQVQPAFWADDWKKLVNNKEAGLLFRLSHPATSGEAFEQMRRTRDAQIIQQHLTWLVKPPKSNWTRWRPSPSSVAFLLKIGDKNGDVYDPLIKRIQTGRCPGGFTPYRITRVCARIAPDRAWKDFQKILVDRRGFVESYWVAANMCYTGKTAAVDKAFEMLEDPKMRYWAIQSISSALTPYYSSFELPPRWGQLRQHALPLVRNALASDKVNEHDKAELQGLFRKLLQNQK
ncbi:MAG: hypothetical protein IID44_16045 [Planctomycetes bacterium]|nr:hypothetical protein [Planctomycetota bacterium]